MKGDLVKDVFFGFVGLHILHSAQNKPVYGAAIREELRRHGYQLSFGTLYPLFHRLERKGLLQSELQLSSGRIRRLYSITQLGNMMLAEGKLKAKELLLALEQ